MTQSRTEMTFDQLFAWLDENTPNSFTLIKGSAEEGYMTVVFDMPKEEE
jgi:hypothetical protein